LPTSSLLQLVVGDLAEHSTSRRAHDDRSEHRRGGQPDEEADAAAPLRARTPKVVAGLLDRHLAIGIVGHEDDGLESDLLRLHPFEQRVEILVRAVDTWVPDDQDIGHFIRHDGLPSGLNLDRHPPAAK